MLHTLFYSLMRTELLSFFECLASPCFFFLGAPMPPGLTRGPDHVCKGSFAYEKFVVLNGTSGGSNRGSMYCEEPRGYPSAPSWCGGGNFSLLLLAFACDIRRRLCFRHNISVRWYLAAYQLGPKGHTKYARGITGLFWNQCDFLFCLGFYELLG